MALTDKEREKWEKLMGKISGKQAEWMVNAVPDVVRDDIDLVRPAVARDPDNFQHCSDRLRNDDDLARLAIEKNPAQFVNCSVRLRDADDFARFAIEKDGFNFKSCSARLRDDTAFATWAVEKGPSNFSYCSARLRDDDDFARSAVKKSPSNLASCSARMRDDFDIARLAMEKYPDAIRMCTRRLQADPIMRAHKVLVLAKQKTQQPDLSAFPQSIQDAWQHAQWFHPTGNTAEAREYFALLAKGTMAAESRREQGIAAEPLKPSHPAQDISDQLDMDAFDLSR